MTHEQITYLVFAIVLVVAVVLDLGLLSKKNAVISIQRALWQTLFWVGLAVAFFGFMWVENGQNSAVLYLSAYLTEWSLSIDNIFVFILIFGFFKIKAQYVSRGLMIGILLAIVLRIAFIAIGVELVEKAGWILYIFGAFLLYTGIKIFTVKEEDEFDPANNPVYRFMNKVLPIVPEDGNGKFVIVREGRKYYTNMFVVIVLLATTDIIFAVDSIPAVFAIVQDSPDKELIIYTSNIFAVLGLRSLYFLLKGAANKFAYLQQGIAIVLIFIGVKMLISYFHIHIPAYISLIVIAVCIFGSIGYSMQVASEKSKHE